MKEEYKNSSIKFGQYYLDIYSFFKQLTLLMKAVADELTMLGLKPRSESYGLPYFFHNTDIYSMGFTIPKAIVGRFYDKKDAKNPAEEIVHYCYSIMFKEHDPESLVEPWIPILYFMKGVLVSPSEWDYWKWNSRLLDEKPTGGTGLTNNQYLISILTKEYEKLSDLGDKIEQVHIIRIPLISITTSDIIKRLVKPVVQALKGETETPLTSEVKEFLIRADDI